MSGKRRKPNSTSEFRNRPDEGSRGVDAVARLVPIAQVAGSSNRRERPAGRAAKVPAYRARPEYGQAIVTLTDAASGKRRDYWLGEIGSPESRGGGVAGIVQGTLLAVMGQHRLAHRRSVKHSRDRWTISMRLEIEDAALKVFLGYGSASRKSLTMGTSTAVC